ncbi:MAG: hypothetical protein KJO97_11365 [Acidimicrobiia bacterium]|nr:hypothetical protein [Acidimicrobiia bacterium]
MSYAYIDTAGVRERRSRLEFTAIELGSIRAQASVVLTQAQVSHECRVLEPLAEAASFADSWSDRLTEYVTDAELGPAWRIMAQFFGSITWGQPDRETLRRLTYRHAVGQVVEAMRNGESPVEAGLSPRLFPPEYVAVFERIGRLEDEAVDLAVEAYVLGAGDGARIDALLADAEQLRPSYDLEAIRQFIYATPVLESIDERDAVFADVLVGDLEAAGFDEPWTRPAPRQLEVAVAELSRGTAGLAAAFFTRLGPDRTALIDAHFRRADDQSGVEEFSRALAEASHVLPDRFAVDLIRADDSQLMFELRVGTLFAEGDFEFDFLQAAYDQAELQFGGDRYVGWTDAPIEFDARTVLLNRIVEHPRFTPVSFLTPARIAGLFDDPYIDDGFSAMKALLALGALDPAMAGVRDRIADVVTHVGQAGGTLQPHMALGVATMVDAHIPLFAVERWYNQQTGRFDDPIDSTARSQSLQLPRYGPADDVGQIAFEKDKVMFLEVVMRDPAAQMQLFESLAGSVAALSQAHMTDVESAISGSDELGALVGRFADVAGGLAQQEGKARDSANKWNKWLVGTTIAVAGSLLVAHYVSGVAAATLLKQVIGVARSTTTTLSLNRIFPTDNEKGALEGRFHDVVSIEHGRDYLQFVTQVLFTASPGLFDLERIPTTVVADGRWVDPTGGSHGFCIDPDVWLHDWTEWWNSDPFVEPGTYDLVATVSDSFSKMRSSGSAIDVNGPDLPFTRP